MIRLGWSYDQLCACPADYVDILVALLSGDAEADSWRQLVDTTSPQ